MQGHLYIDGCPQTIPQKRKVLKINWIRSVPYLYRRGSASDTSLPCNILQINKLDGARRGESNPHGVASDGF
jgi:hypothetical protein